VPMKRHAHFLLVMTVTARHSGDPGVRVRVMVRVRIGLGLG